MLRTIKAFIAPLSGNIILVLLAALALAVLFAKAESRRADKWQSEAIERGMLLMIQNDAVEKMKADADRKQAEGKAELERVKRETQALATQAERLRGSSARVASGPCVISDELRKATGL